MKISKVFFVGLVVAGSVGWVPLSADPIHTGNLPGEVPASGFAGDVVNVARDGSLQVLMESVSGSYLVDVRPFGLQVDSSFLNAVALNRRLSCEVVYESETFVSGYCFLTLDRNPGVPCDSRIQYSCGGNLGSLNLMSMRLAGAQEVCSEIDKENSSYVVDRARYRLLCSE